MLFLQFLVDHIMLILILLICLVHLCHCCFWYLVIHSHFFIEFTILFLNVIHKCSVLALQSVLLARMIRVDMSFLGIMVVFQFLAFCIAVVGFSDSSVLLFFFKLSFCVIISQLKTLELSLVSLDGGIVVLQLGLDLVLELFDFCIIVSFSDCELTLHVLELDS